MSCLKAQQTRAGNRFFSPIFLMETTDNCEKPGLGKSQRRQKNCSGCRLWGASERLAKAAANRERDAPTTNLPK